MKPTIAASSTSRPAGPAPWLGMGDINAFFGLALDNLAAMSLAVGLLAAAFEFPADFAMRRMIPGTALGVLFGDLMYTWMAIRLGRRLGRPVTAMPLGLDTPSTFGMVLFVLGPAYRHALAGGANPEAAAQAAWGIGVCLIVISGLFKLVCALGAGAVRRLVPRAGLLGSLAAIALALISFLPLLEILESPLVGIVSLVILLGSLLAGLKLPGNVPGALAVVAVGTAMHYALEGCGVLGSHANAAISAPWLAGGVDWLPTDWLAAWRMEWLGSLPGALPYLPVVIPFALATVVGGIDCAESAAAAGDEFDTRGVIAVEAVATLLAGFCGGVIQSTPYIGHPAYKAMGGRSGYTLATALFIGSAGVVGYFALAFAWLPKAAVFPILVFVGLEITKQSFLATPSRHYAAVALACLPAMAYLVMIFGDNMLGSLGKTPDELPNPLGQNLQTLRMLASGFVVTSLLWASTLAAMVDRRMFAAAGYLALAGACSLFGVIHSPLAGSPLSLPWRIAELPRAAIEQSPIRMAVSYALAAIFVALWGLLSPSEANQAAKDEPAGGAA